MSVCVCVCVCFISTDTYPPIIIPSPDMNISTTNLAIAIVVPVVSTGLLAALGFVWWKRRKRHAKEAKEQAVAAAAEDKSKQDKLPDEPADVSVKHTQTTFGSYQVPCLYQTRLSMQLLVCAA